MKTLHQLRSEVRREQAIAEQEERRKLEEARANELGHVINNWKWLLYKVFEDFDDRIKEAIRFDAAYVEFFVYPGKSDAADWLATKACSMLGRLGYTAHKAVRGSNDSLTLVTMEDCFQGKVHDDTCRTVVVVELPDDPLS